MSCGLNNIFGGSNCTWIIILVLVLVCCGGDNGCGCANDCGCNNGCC